jgi:hypothetical protein
LPRPSNRGGNGKWTLSMISWPGRGRSGRDETDILFAFREWLKAQEGRAGKLSLRTEADGSFDDDTVARAFHLSPGIAAVEPPVDLKRVRASNKRSFASRLARVIVNCLIIFAVVGAAVAWLQYADDQTKADIQTQAAKTWDMASGWLLSALHIDTRPSSDAASTPSPENSNGASLQDAATSPAGPVAQPASKPPPGAAAAQPALAPTQAGAIAQQVQAPVASANPAELQQKFDALQNNIADIRRIVERIASRQEQMTRDMVTLQTTQQLLAQKLSTPPQAMPLPPAPHAKKMPYPEASAAPRLVPSPPPRPGTSTPSY